MNQLFQRLITFSATGFAIGTLFGTAGAGTVIGASAGMAFWYREKQAEKDREADALIYFLDGVERAVIENLDGNLGHDIAEVGVSLKLVPSEAEKTLEALDNKGFVAYRDGEYFLTQKGCKAKNRLKRRKP